VTAATPPGYQFTTNPKRVLFALLTAAFIGAITLWFTALWGYIGSSGWQDGLLDWLLRGRTLVPLALVFFLLGSVICGGPIGALPHFQGLRRWWHTTATGFLVAFGVSFGTATAGFDGLRSGQFSFYARGQKLWINGILTQEGWQDALTGALKSGALCGALGFVIWFVACKRT